MRIMSTARCVVVACVVIVSFSDGLGGRSSLQMQMTVTVGDSITLPCHTNMTVSVDWLYHLSPTHKPSNVFLNEKVHVDYKSKVRVFKSTPGDYSLTILRAEIDDTGIYTCREDSGLGQEHVISLIVTDSSSTATVHGSTQSCWVIGCVVCACLLTVAAVVIVIVFLCRKRLCLLIKCMWRNDKKGGKTDECRSMFRRSSSDDVSSRPTRHNSSEEQLVFVNQHPVVGVSLLGNAIYIVYARTGWLDVYDKSFKQPIVSFAVDGLSSPKDMASCAINKCLYVTDYVQDCVFKLSRKGRVMKHWPITSDNIEATDVDHPMGISVTKTCNVLVTCPDKLKLRLFTPEGRLLREIGLDHETLHAWHSILLKSGKIIICHGSTKMDDQVHRVCLLDPTSSETPVVDVQYGGIRGSGDRHLDVPRHMAIDKDGFIYVADMNNRRVLLFDQELKYMDVLYERKPPAEDEQRIYWKLFRISLDETDENNRKLYVVGVMVDDDGPQRGCVMMVALGGLDVFTAE